MSLVLLLFLSLLFSFDSLISPNCSILIALRSTISTKLLINLLHIFDSQDSPSCAQTAAPLAVAACATLTPALLLLRVHCAQRKGGRERVPKSVSLICF